MPNIQKSFGQHHERLRNIYRAKKEFCLLGGDLNKLVGCDDLGVEGNYPEISPGGQMLRDLLATRD